MDLELYLLITSCILLGLSYYGWGAILFELTTRSGPERIVPWIAPVTGSAFLTLLGGLLASLGVFTVSIVLIFVLLGATFGVMRLNRQGDAWRWAQAAIVFLVIVFVLTVQLNRFIGADDKLAYLPLAMDLLAQGTIDQPFAVRVGLNPNGHAVIGSIWLAMGGRGALSFYDTVPLLISLLLWAGRSPGRDQFFRLSVAIVIITAQYLAWNTAPTIWIVGAIIAIVELVRNPKDNPTHAITATALILAAGYSLRSYWLLPLTSLAIVLSYPGRADMADWLRKMGAVAFVSTLFVLPFLWMSTRQFETPCSLLFSGTLHPDLVSGSTGNAFLMLRELAAQPEFIIPLVLLTLSLGIQRRFGLLVLILSILLFGIHSASNLTWHYVQRMQSGILYGVLFFGLITLNEKYRRAYLFPLFLITPFGVAGVLERIPASFSLARTYEEDRIGKTQGILEAQLSTEPGVKLLSFVSHPAQHQFHRNKIYLGDMPGGLKTETWRSWTEVEAFARKHEIQYVLFSNPGAPESKPRYREQIEWFAQHMPPFYQGRWIDQQRALLDIAADCFASDLGLRFGNTCIVPVEAAATDGP